MIDKALLLKTRELSEQLIALQTPIRILDAINWDKQIKETFFSQKCQKNPLIDSAYYQQRDLGFVPSELRQAFSNLHRNIINQLGQLNPISQQFVVIRLKLLEILHPKCISFVVIIFLGRLNQDLFSSIMKQKSTKF